MRVTRRDMLNLLPLLSAVLGAEGAGLHSEVFDSGEIAFTGDASKKSREFFKLRTHSGFQIEMHQTQLAPGVRTHEPHKHEHEEAMVLVEGTLEVYVEGKTSTAGPGSVIYFGSNEMHSVRNAGQTLCSYYVLELRGV